MWARSKLAIQEVPEMLPLLPFITFQRNNIGRFVWYEIHLSNWCGDSWKVTSELFVPVGEADTAPANGQFTQGGTESTPSQASHTNLCIGQSNQSDQSACWLCSSLVGWNWNQTALKCDNVRTSLSKLASYATPGDIWYLRETCCRWCGFRPQICRSHLVMLPFMIVISFTSVFSVSL